MASVKSQLQGGIDTALQKVSEVLELVMGDAETLQKVIDKHTALQVMRFSDRMADMEARFTFMVDDGGSVQELENKIFASAQAARGGYLDTMETVTELGLRAGDAFSGNDETIRFTELLNKGFAVAGTTTKGQGETTEQIIEAMVAGQMTSGGAGMLAANAPLLAEGIGAQIQGVPGGLEEWAAQGLITSEVLKAALFATADETEARFAALPMRWADIWNSFQGQAIRVMGPVLDKVGRIANMGQMDSVLAGAVGVLGTVLLVLGGILDFATVIGALVVDNWSVISPLIWGVVAAIIAYNAMMGIGWLTTLKTVAANVAHAIASAAETAAIIALTFAQNGLNAALALCPITWIIIAVIALIAIFYAAVAAVNQFAGTSYSATGMIVGAFAVAGAFIGNLILGVVNFIIGLGVELYNLIGVFANFFANIFNNPVGAIINLFAGMFDFILGIVQAAASLIDTVFGTDMSGAVEGFRNTVADKVAEIVGDQIEVMPKLNAADYQLDMIDYGGAWDAGYALGEGLEDKVGGLFNFDSPTGGGEDLYNPDWDSMGNGIAETAANTGATADAVSATTEDLKYLRDLAEVEAINRFTTAEVKIDMAGMTNRIDSAMDLDGVITKLADGFSEALVVAAEGVHT